jgi:hypothetical protein
LSCAASIAGIASAANNVIAVMRLKILDFMLRLLILFFVKVSSLERLQGQGSDTDLRVVKEMDAALRW